jgi:hypothetical protein
MSIDQEADSDTTQTSNASTEPADTAADLASQDSGTQDAEESSSTAPATDPQNDEGSSSTSSDTTLQTADQKEGEPAHSQVDWQAEKARYEKRVADLRAAQGRTANELHQYRQRFKDIDPDAARKALALSQKQEYQPWHPKSPEHRSFNATKDSWERYKRALGRAKTPEARAAVQETMGSTFTEKEAQQIEAWETHKAQDAERRASDPEYEREMRREELREELRQEMQAQREEAEVAAWFGNTANQPIVEKYRDEMITLMNEGWHWPQVQRYIEAKSKADGLQSRVGSAEVKSAAARAQQAALKSNAKASRDPAQAPVGKLDFAKMGADYAKKLGLPMTHERVLAHVEKLVADFRKTNPNT